MALWLTLSRGERATNARQEGAIRGRWGQRLSARQMAENWR